MTFSRAFMVMAAVVFAAFEIGVYVANVSGASGRVLDWLGGGLAIAFIATVAVLLARTRLVDRGARRATVAFLQANPAVVDEVGAPVRISRVTVSRDGDGATSTARVSGPRGAGDAEVATARTGAVWRVVGATLRSDGVGVTLPVQPA